MAVKVYLTQNKNGESSAFGKWYAYADNEKPIDLVGLAHHMSQHNTPFTEGTIIGILRDMVSCIRELNLNGQPVKIDNLAIFSAHIENKRGWTSIADVDLTVGNENSVIQAIRQCAQATGDFTKQEMTKYGTVQLNREWRLKVQAAKQTPGDTSSDGDTISNDSTSGNDSTGGNDSTSGNSSTGGNGSTGGGDE